MNPFEMTFENKVKLLNSVKEYIKGKKPIERNILGTYTSELTYRENWRPFMLIREALQNALDAMTDKEGEFYRVESKEQRDKIIQYDNKIITVSDTLGGIKGKAFAFGSTKTKNSKYRGQFGEGIKIGALATFRVYPKLKIVIITRDDYYEVSFKETTIDSEKMYKNILKHWKTNTDVDGTIMYILNTKVNEMEKDMNDTFKNTIVNYLNPENEKVENEVAKYIYLLYASKFIGTPSKFETEKAIEKLRDFAKSSINFNLTLKDLIIPDDTIISEFYQFAKYYNNPVGLRVTFVPLANILVVPVLGYLTHASSSSDLDADRLDFRFYIRDYKNFLLTQDSDIQIKAALSLLYKCEKAIYKSYLIPINYDTLGEEIFLHLREETPYLDKEAVRKVTKDSFFSITDQFVSQDLINRLENDSGKIYIGDCVSMSLASDLKLNTLKKIIDCINKERSSLFKQIFYMNESNYEKVIMKRLKDKPSDVVERILKVFKYIFTELKYRNDKEGSFETIYFIERNGQYQGLADSRNKSVAVVAGESIAGTLYILAHELVHVIYKTDDKTSEQEVLTKELLEELLSVYNEEFGIKLFDNQEE